MARRIPMEDFFRNPEKCYVMVSPRGHYLSWMEPWERRLNIYVKNLQSGEVVRVTSVTERDVQSYFWANDQRIIYAMDKDGDENVRLIAVDWDGGNHIDLTPLENVKCMLLDELINDDEHILFGMNQRNPELFDVYRLNVNSGEMEIVAENWGDITDWLCDHDGKLRLAISSDGVNNGVFYRPTEADEWKEIAVYNFRESFAPLFFTFDNRALYASSNVGRDKAAIVEYNLDTQTENKVIFAHPEVDVNTLIRSTKRKVITGVYFETDRGQYQLFDDHRKRIQEFVDAKLPLYQNVVVNSDLDESIYIIYSSNDRTYGSYYWLDVRAWKLNKLFDLAPWLHEEELAEMKSIQYSARDGLPIKGYLSLPPGVEPNKLPLVVNPHGGPWARDSWGFNPEVQFLVNRGYAVLQMNFRGSTGYGRQFWEASFKQWGLSMQDDITDGVMWMIDQGIADPTRIAIYGGSYGGYATLMGIVKTPDLYAAAVDYVGVANLFTFMDSFPAYWKPIVDMMHEMIGHPDQDAELYKAVSPVMHVDRIKTPLFIAQGANDPRVKQHESDQMVEALRQRGIAVEYMVKENEGHGFANEENSFDFYNAMEAFLRKHIG